MTTLNQHLRRHGYLTIGIGKVHHERIGYDTVHGDNRDRWFDLAHETHWVASDMRPHNRKLWVKDEFEVNELLWRAWDLFRDYSGHLMTNWGAHNIDMVQYVLGMDKSGPVKVMPLDENTARNRKFDITESALEQDWKKKWCRKTPRPNESFSDAIRFRPITMEYANGTVLNFLPGIGTARFFGERGTMEISRNKFVTDPIDLVKDASDMSDAA